MKRLIFGLLLLVLAGCNGLASPYWSLMEDVSYNYDRLDISQESRQAVLSTASVTLESKDYAQDLEALESLIRDHDGSLQGKYQSHHFRYLHGSI